MLENIITNPIDTPRGYKNPSRGIALRGPLSQFFSGLYLKPVDDALSKMNVTYLRYQDDLLVLCKTKRQLHRCRRRMMEVLHERQLSLSRKKSRMGCINDGFHFLGIDYLPTQKEDNTSATHANDASINVITPTNNVYYMNVNGGKVEFEHQKHGPICIVPHPRTLRKAREQVKYMVIDKVSPSKIRNYLNRWIAWWTMTSMTWQYQELLQQFINVCWDKQVADYAAALHDLHLKALHTVPVLGLAVAA